jgi:hypothetical protein
MTIYPRADQEQRIQEAINAGIVRCAEDVIEVGLERLNEQLGSFASSKALEAAMLRIRSARVHNHLPEGMTLRDLIHEGRA